MNNKKIVREHWGPKPPDWVLVLADHCDRTSQNKVSLALGYSDSVVNQVLHKRYKAHLTTIEKAVNGAFMNVKVTCPVLGEIALHHCLEHQRAKFMATNSMRVRLYKACRGIGGPRCPHAKSGGQL